MSKTKRTERLTPASSETLLHMLETLPDALFLVNDAETITYVNTSAQTMTGSSREALLGNSFWHGAPQLLSPSLYQAMRKTRQTQEPTEVEYWSPMTRNWLRAQLTPTVEGLTLQFHQMRTPTPRQETFPQGERLCIDDLDGLHTRIGILTPEGIVLDINAVPLDDAQVPREEVIGKPLAETPWWSFAPASQEQLRAAIARANAGETVCFEALVRPREGMLLSFESVITPHMDADHHIEYLVIAGIDVTARKRAERDIHALIDAIPQLVWTGRPDGYVDSYNQRWRDYTGLSTEEAQGDGWMQCTHPDDRQRVLETWQRAVQTGEPYETEQRLRHGTTGEYRWFLMQATPYTDAQGTILKYVGTCTDIHDKKRAEAETRALIDAIPQFVWMLGPDGSSEYGNQRWCDYTDMTFEQYQGDGWLQAIHPDDSQHTLTLWRHALETGEPFEIEYRLKNGQTGGYRWFLARALPIRDEIGQIVKWFGTCTDIHEKKQVEDDIRVLVDAIPQFVWIMRPDGSAEYANPRWCEYTGMTSQQYQGDGWLQAIHSDDQQRVLAGWQSAVQAGRPYEAEQRLRNGTTGDYRWFLARGAPFKDAQGTILKYFGTSTDIDEQKQAEQRSKTSEENWRVLAETVPQFVWTTRPDGSVEYWSQRWYDYSGSSSEQALGHGWSQFLHPDDYERALTIWHHALAVGEPYEIEYRLKEGQTGAYRWFLARGMPVRDEAGQILKWFGTCTDIEEQKRAEQRLKESEENWRVLAETVPHLVWAVRLDGRLEYANQRAYDSLGASPEYMLGEEWRQFLHPEDYERVQAVRRHLIETGEPYEIEYRLKEGQTGAYRWFLGRALPVRDETDQVVKWLGTSTDIDEQKRMEEALRESQERVNILMNSSIIGIFFAEGEQIVDANDTYLRMTGYTRQDLREGSINWMRMTPPEYLARTQQARQELVVQQYGTPYEKEYVCKDGSRLPVVVGVVALRRDSLHTIGFMLDNSARKELEQRKDDFISMASHELKTPLTALKMQTQLMRKRLERQSLHEAATALSRVEGPVKQLERLVGELLDVSKIQAGRLEYLQETVDLDALLYEVADMMQQISPTHTIVVRNAAPCLLVGDKDRLGQVFTNLISNAIKYSPGADTVEIDLDASPEAAIIGVHDHGLGIPREQCDKIFERFYRAAGPKQKAIPGLGMGLYIVAEIVKRHGGTITVESIVGEGSTFTVTLPLNRDT